MCHKQEACQGKQQRQHHAPPSCIGNGKSQSNQGGRLKDEDILVANAAQNCRNSIAHAMDPRRAISYASQAESGLRSSYTLIKLLLKTGVSQADVSSQE